MTLPSSSAPCSVDGMIIIPFDISHCMPETNELSSINPSAHQPALFLIQSGIIASWAEMLGVINTPIMNIPKNTNRLFFSNTIMSLGVNLYQYLLTEGDYYI